MLLIELEVAEHSLEHRLEVVEHDGACSCRASQASPLRTSSQSVAEPAKLPSHLSVVKDLDGLAYAVHEVVPRELRVHPTIGEDLHFL